MFALNLSVSRSFQMQNSKPFFCNAAFIVDCLLNAIHLLAQKLPRAFQYTLTFSKLPSVCRALEDLDFTVSRKLAFLKSVQLIDHSFWVL